MYIYNTQHKYILFCTSIHPPHSNHVIYFPNKKLLQKPSIPMIPEGAFTIYTSLALQHSDYSSLKFFQLVNIQSLFCGGWNCVDYLIVASLDIQLSALWQVDILAVDKGAANNANWPQHQHTGKACPSSHS